MLLVSGWSVVIQKDLETLVRSLLLHQEIWPKVVDGWGGKVRILRSNCLLSCLGLLDGEFAVNELHSSDNIGD